MHSALERCVSDIAHLSLETGQERGHGVVYDALSAESIAEDDLCKALASTTIPAIQRPDGKDGIALAEDVSNWLHPAVRTIPDRSFSHVYARGTGPALL